LYYDTGKTPLDQINICTYIENIQNWAISIYKPDVKYMADVFIRHLLRGKITTQSIHDLKVQFDETVLTRTKRFRIPDFSSFRSKP